MSDSNALAYGGAAAVALIVHLAAFSAAFWLIPRSYTHTTMMTPPEIHTLPLMGVVLALAVSIVAAPMAVLLGTHAVLEAAEL